MLHSPQLAHPGWMLRRKSHVNFSLSSCCFQVTSRPALMAVWSQAPPLTADCLSPLAGFESRPGLVRRLPVIWS